jgi:hypothetical protein
MRSRTNEAHRARAILGQEKILSGGSQSSAARVLDSQPPPTRTFPTASKLDERPWGKVLTTSLSLDTGEFPLALPQQNQTRWGSFT